MGNANKTGLTLQNGRSLLQVAQLPFVSKMLRSVRKHKQVLGYSEGLCSQTTGTPALLQVRWQSTNFYIQILNIG